MRRLEISHPARQDIEDIWQYIAAYNVPAADRQIDRLNDAFTLLVHHPGGGQDRSDLEPHLRSFPVGNYLVLYREKGDALQIVRAVHGARDLASLFKKKNR